MAGFEASRPERHNTPAEPSRIDPLACYDELKIYLQNDVWASRLREDGRPYLLVSYESVNERMADIVKFIGSSAPPDAIADLVECPVTLKLPEVPATNLIANIAELEPIFHHFEQLRTCLLA